MPSWFQKIMGCEKQQLVCLNNVRALALKTVKRNIVWKFIDQNLSFNRVYLSFRGSALAPGNCFNNSKKSCCEIYLVRTHQIRSRWCQNYNGGSSKYCLKGWLLKNISKIMLKVGNQIYLYLYTPISFSNLRKLN